MKVLEFEWQSLDEGEPWYVCRVRLPAKLSQGATPDEPVVEGFGVSIDDKKIPSRALLGFPINRCRGFKIVDLETGS